MQARRFFLDSTTRSFTGDPLTALPSIGGAFFREDIEAVELYFLERTADQALPFRFIDYSSNTIKLAVGVTAPAALQTSWTSLSTTITASITSTVTGGGGANAVRRLAFSGRQPADGAISLRLAEDDITGSISDNRIFTSDFGAIFNGRAVLLVDTGDYSGEFFMVNVGRGSFQIANTADGEPLEISGSVGDIFPRAFTIPQITDISADGIRNAVIASGMVNAVGRPLIEVSGSYQSGFDLEFVDLLGDSSRPNLTVSSTLAAAPGFAAPLNFNTTEIAAIIAAGQANDCKLEVEVTDPSNNRQTYQQPAQLAADIITSTSPLPVPVGPTTSTLNFDDGAGGTWAVSVDANGVLTATKV